MSTEIKRMWGGSPVDPLAVYKAQLEALRAFLFGARVLSEVALARAGNFNIGHGAFGYQLDATSARVETFRSKQADTTGVVPAAGNIPANLWGAYLVRLQLSDGAVSIVAAAGNATGYATEALAIAAVPAVASGFIALGYVTVRAAVGNAFIPGTSALQGGSGGNPAQTTNYYDAGANYAGVADDLGNFTLLE